MASPSPAPRQNTKIRNPESAREISGKRSAVNPWSPMVAICDPNRIYVSSILLCITDCCFVQNLCQDLWKLRILYTGPSQKLTDGQAVQHYVNGLVLDMMIHILYCQLVVKNWNSFSYFVFFIGVNRVSNSLKNIIHKEIYVFNS